MKSNLPEFEFELRKRDSMLAINYVIAVVLTLLLPISMMAEAAIGSVLGLRLSSSLASSE